MTFGSFLQANTPPAAAAAPAAGADAVGRRARRRAAGGWCSLRVRPRPGPPPPPEPIVLRLPPAAADRRRRRRRRDRRRARPAARRGRRPSCSRPEPSQPPPPVEPSPRPEPEPPAEAVGEDAAGAAEPAAGAGPPVRPGDAGAARRSGDAALELRDVARAPPVLAQVKPEYPREARWNRMEGMVVLRVVIGIDGRVDRREHARGALGPRSWTRRPSPPSSSGASRRPSAIRDSRCGWSSRSRSTSPCGELHAERRLAHRSCSGCTWAPVWPPAWSCGDVGHRGGHGLRAAAAGLGRARQPAGRARASGAPPGHRAARWPGSGTSSRRPRPTAADRVRRPRGRGAGGHRPRGRRSRRPLHRRGAGAGGRRAGAAVLP